jgi:hypothetical protein
MAKQKPEIRIRTWVIYTQWDSDSKSLPKIVEVTTNIPAEVDIEFGFIVNIKGAKNQQLHYCIDHPGILDTEERLRDPFTGTVYIKTNDWDFFLGDTIWNPIEDKLGQWHLSLELNGAVIAEKTFDVAQPIQSS